MSVGELERAVAKKAGDTTLRVDMETAEILRKVSVLKGVSVGDFLRAVVLPIAKKELMNEARKITKQGEGDR